VTSGGLSKFAKNFIEKLTQGLVYLLLASVQIDFLFRKTEQICTSRLNFDFCYSAKW
jgi:hypothetical protein